MKTSHSAPYVGEEMQAQVSVCKEMQLPVVEIEALIREEVRPSVEPHVHTQNHKSIFECELCG